MPARESLCPPGNPPHESIKLRLGIREYKSDTNSACRAGYRVLCDPRGSLRSPVVKNGFVACALTLWLSARVSASQDRRRCTKATLIKYKAPPPEELSHTYTAEL